MQNNQLPINVESVPYFELQINKFMNKFATIRLFKEVANENEIPRIQYVVQVHKKNITQTIGTEKTEENAIAIACEHAGFNRKGKLMNELKKLNKNGNFHKVGSIELNKIIRTSMI